jgi:hypothetical protein
MLLPEHSDGTEISKFTISECVGVGKQRDPQIVRGTMIHCDGSTEEMTAYFYDPAYLNSYSHPFELPTDEERSQLEPEEIVPPLRGIPRRTLAFGSFGRKAYHLRDVAELQIPGTAQPLGLIDPPAFYRAFFPCRELASERAVAVLTWDPCKGTNAVAHLKGLSTPEEHAALRNSILNTIECCWS